jgi:hypothetical protein
MNDMHDLYKLKDMLLEELKSYGQGKELSTGSLEMVDKLAHTVKNLCKICESAEEEEEYSRADGRGGSYRMRGSYADEGGSYRRRRDSMGRYSGDGRMMPYYNGNSYEDNMGNYAGERGRGGRGYSREDAREDMVRQLRELKMSAPDEETRRMVDKWIKQTEND